jgi:hypothetical protein
MRWYCVGFLANKLSTDWLTGPGVLSAEHIKDWRTQFLQEPWFLPTVYYFLHYIMVTALRRYQLIRNRISRQKLIIRYHNEHRHLKAWPWLRDRSKWKPSFKTSEHRGRFLAQNHLICRRIWRYVSLLLCYAIYTQIILVLIVSATFFARSEESRLQSSGMWRVVVSG